ncbi:protein kinase, partial [uncultured Thiodictyon sp.]|uniref:serine/threonine protein kinase n=1 Tax=uncultured Thiodictyon sp. TaxID=1846217 RepID=UPI0025E9A802
MTAPAHATRCPGCFAEKGRANPCPRCGYDEMAQRSPLLLPQRMLLNGQFVVGRVLVDPGAFSISYLCWDLNLEACVAIREYLPRELAGRAADGVSVACHSLEDGVAFRFGLEQFRRQASVLAQLHHPSLARVRQLFKANCTAYVVMDYYQGFSLADYLQCKGGRLSEEQAKQLLLPLLAGLRVLHAKGALHGDIKPAHIYLVHLESGGLSPLLIGFGAARQAIGERRGHLSAVLSAGYAPFEQYHGTAAQGPWTDIYAVAAVLYQMVTGTIPPAATDREEHDTLQPAADFGVTAALSETIGAALAQSPQLRLQSAQEFQSLLAGGAAAVPPPSTPTPAVSSMDIPAAAWIRPAPIPPWKPPRPLRTWGSWLSWVLVLGIGCAFVWWERTRQEPQGFDVPGTMAAAERPTGPSRACLDACMLADLGPDDLSERGLAVRPTTQQPPVAEPGQDRRDRDDVAYEMALRKDVASAYRDYLENCAADGCGHQAQAQEAMRAVTGRDAKSDDEQYAKAQRADTGDAYFAYLNACAATGCRHEAEARQRLASRIDGAFDRGLGKLQATADQQRALNDDARFMLAHTENTLAAYRRYLKHCTGAGCMHQGEAKRQLAELTARGAGPAAQRPADATPAQERRQQASVAKASEPASAAEASEPAPAADASEQAPVAKVREPAPVARVREPAPVAKAREPAPAARAREPAPAVKAREPAPA